MKKIFIPVLALALFWPQATLAETIVNLFDISGSLSENCGPAFRKNLEKLNQVISTLNKNDRFILVLYRSHRPIKLIDFSMPDKSGGKNQKILNARKFLRQELASKFPQTMNNSQSIKAAGAGTDNLGAINFAALLVGDLQEFSVPIALNIFSDGITSLGKILSDKNGNYLEALGKHLAKSSSPGLAKIDSLFWYGDSCFTDSLILSEATKFKNGLKQIWTDYLRNQGVSKVDFILDY